jgi:hypothetical protein
MSLTENPGIAPLREPRVLFLFWVISHNLSTWTTAVLCFLSCARIADLEITCGFTRPKTWVVGFFPVSWGGQAPEARAAEGSSSGEEYSMVGKHHLT